MADNTSFYEMHSVIAHELIVTMQVIPRAEEQPDFVHQAIINGRLITFLGKEALPKDILLGKFIRTNKIVIPEGARMVNTDTLRTKLKTTYQPFDMEEEDFLGQPLTETIMFEVCHDLVSTNPPVNKIHICENHNEFGSHSYDSNGTCGWPLYSIQAKDGEIERDITIFYIDKDKIKVVDENIIEIHNEHNKEDDDKIPKDTPVIEELLQNFYERPYIEGKYDYLAKFKKNQLKGVFLISTLFSDQRVVYHCVPNAQLEIIQTSKYNQNTLSNWLDAITEPINDNQEIAISGNDEHYIYIEDWSIFLCKNASPKIVTKKS